MKATAKIRLRPFTPEDLPKLKEWNEDEDLAVYLGLKLPGEEVDYYQRCEKLLRERTSRIFAIEDETGHFIGEVELNQITWRRKQAELHICIGEHKYWGRGFGTEAVRAVLNLAFQELGLESIYLRVYRHNKRAIRCYEKCGFKKEAVLRNRFRSQCGRGYDILLMNISADDFTLSATAS
ncbi:MAG TPA: GNAT family N-acetyltransferase [Firmicutes bacterium]|jgi:RimJ/RimL family protein N-acetyltransferase|nr:GNAT family N-acetyltransferase [Bacillota bacterium]